MSRRRRAACVLVAALAGVSAPQAHAQGWYVDVSAGQTLFDPVSSRVASSNLMASLRFEAERGAWVYGGAAAPLRARDPFWGAAGSGGRFVLAGSDLRAASAGVELSGHGFAYRDPVAVATGAGGILEAVPFTSVSVGGARVEVRGGWRGHTFTYAGTTQNRGVVEGGARLTYGTALRVRGETRVVRASEGTYPFVGGLVAYARQPVHVWAQAGRWVSETLDDVAWSAGMALAPTSRIRVWVIARQEAPDPLYWNASRRTWSAGVTTQIGRSRIVAHPSSHGTAGRVVIRVPVADVPAATELWIAGSFNDWQPVRMERDGRHWTIDLPLAAGVYHYAFRSGAGEWFVPRSVAGRRDDGMGGDVAVLVVS